MQLDDQEQQTTLRDDIAASFDEHVESVEVSEQPETQLEAVAEPQQTEGERSRDERGRFAARQQDQKQEQAQPPQTEQAAPKYQRPSTWKKETWGIWDKLNANQPLTPEEIHLMAQEAVRRDQDFARGVSTYKSEADSAKELRAAIEPFMPELQQHGVAPAQWIQRLGTAHQMLVRGNPQQKMQVFAKLAQDYGVPLQALTGSPEQQAPAQEFMQYVHPVMQQVNQLRGEFQAIQSYQQQQEQQRINQEISRFADGNEHFEQVKETMARLLETGFAKDLQDAFDRAVRQPEHDDIFQAIQKQKAADEANRQAELQRANAQRARNQTTSTRSGAPTAPRGKTGGQSSLRDALNDAFEAHASGRV